MRILFLISILFIISTINCVACGKYTCVDGKGFCLDDTICRCYDKYATYPYESNERCNYEREKQWIAFILEVIIPCGAGHFYAKNYGYAIPKLIYWIIMLTFFILMRIVSERRERKDPKALLFAFWSLILCVGGIIWYVTDAVMYGLNQYNDGHNIPLFAWQNQTII